MVINNNNYLIKQEPQNDKTRWIPSRGHAKVYKSSWTHCFLNEFFDHDSIFLIYVFLYKTIHLNISFLILILSF